MNNIVLFSFNAAQETALEEVSFHAGCRNRVLHQNVTLGFQNRTTHLFSFWKSAIDNDFCVWITALLYIFFLFYDTLTITNFSTSSTLGSENSLFDTKFDIYWINANMIFTAFWFRSWWMRGVELWGVAAIQVSG